MFHSCILCNRHKWICWACTLTEEEIIACIGCTVDMGMSVPYEALTSHEGWVEWCLEKFVDELADTLVRSEIDGDYDVC